MFSGDHLRAAMRKRPAMYVGGMGLYGLGILLSELFGAARELLAASGGTASLVALGPRRFGFSMSAFPPSHPEPEWNRVSRALTLVGEDVTAEMQKPRPYQSVHGLLPGVHGLSIASVLSERSEWRLKHRGEWRALATVKSELQGNWRPAMPFAWHPPAHEAAVEFELGDDLWLPEASFGMGLLNGQLADLAMLTPSMTFELNAGSDSRVHRCPGGLLERFRSEASDLRPIHEPLTVTAERDGMHLNAAFCWTRSSATLLHGWVNDARAEGSHLRGATEALRDVAGQLASPFCSQRAKGTDGTALFLHVKVPFPTWQGPTKGTLADQDVEQFVEWTLRKRFDAALGTEPWADEVREVIRRR